MKIKNTQQKMLRSFFRQQQQPVDITSERPSFEDEQNRMRRDAAFIEVHSDPDLKQIMDSARRIYFNMEQMLQTQSPDSLSSIMLQKGQERYVDFVNSLNDESLTVESATQGAIALAKGLAAITRAIRFLDEDLNVPVSAQDRPDTMVHGFDESRFGQGPELERQVRKLKRRGSGTL